eukprot:scaffold978_cov118-Isochrysis_galbana.AAC.8
MAAGALLLVAGRVEARGRELKGLLALGAANRGDLLLVRSERRFDSRVCPIESGMQHPCCATGLLRDRVARDGANAFIHT